MAPWVSVRPCDRRCSVRAASLTCPLADADPGDCLDIKQEHEPNGLEGLDFNLSPELASKRPFEDVATGAVESPEAKRAKTEGQAEEDSLEDGLALLVQNALSNVGDLVDQFSAGPDPLPAPSTETMDVDSAPTPEPRKVPATFALEPQRYIREMNMHALGNLVRILLLLVQRGSAAR